MIARLQELKGVSQKISNMFVRSLVNDECVSLEGWDRIYIAVDRHVARVFLRTGLVNSRKGQDRYHVNDIVEDVVACARELYPAYPADGPVLHGGPFSGARRESRMPGYSMV